MTLETIFVGGPVYVVDDAFTITDGLGVRDGRVAAWGQQACRLQQTPATRVVDLAGRALLPGFVEAHAHPNNWLTPDVLDVSPSTCPTADDVMRSVHEALAAAEPGAWITVAGWENLLRPELPTMSPEFLTDLAPNNPLAVLHLSAHRSWANKAAMDALHLTADTADPPGSRYLRHDNGTPTGVAEELPATLHLCGPAMAQAASRFDDHVQHQFSALNAAGVTTVSDIAMRPGDGEKYAALAASGATTVRVRGYDTAGAQVVPSPTGMYATLGIKVFVDGSPWVGTMKSSFPYRDSPATRRAGLTPGHHGTLNYTPEELAACVAAAAEAGMQVAFHAQGDLAVEAVLDAMDALEPAQRRALVACRPRLEHAVSITPHQLQRCAALGVTCSFFPAHLWLWGEVIGELYGPQVQSAWAPVGAAVDAGVLCSLHNDHPITPENPLLNMHIAMTRTTRGGTPLGGTRVDFEDALRAHTVWAAWQLHAEHLVGSLELGKAADVVVLGDDPLETAPENLSKISVDQTWLAGRCVYSSDGAHHL